MEEGRGRHAAMDIIFSHRQEVAGRAPDDTALPGAARGRVVLVPRRVPARVVHARTPGVRPAGRPPRPAVAVLALRRRDAPRREPVGDVPGLPLLLVVARVDHATPVPSLVRRPGRQVGVGLAGLEEVLDVLLRLAAGLRPSGQPSPTFPLANRPLA